MNKDKIFDSKQPILGLCMLPARNISTEELVKYQNLVKQANYLFRPAC
jgi:hypothetical protein